ncbi:hypothetical protein JPH1_52940 (plasmid) [Mycobacterium avium subsp. hominissuis]|uniref:Uncharacterized protein n=1 Tax=Mycobacterium avium subsp. hominissuis TaxID=439334 RepID=A0AAI8X2S1_MYCAV|nr:hypothetical protein JPH1_52940 [Mycobacterium avium subsp. hominissuis]
MGSYEAGLRRKAAWRRIHVTCPCGREVYGNRGRDPVPRIRAAEMELARIYLERHARSDKTELSWAEYRDTVWSAADHWTQVRATYPRR